ncbi:MAG TPA: tetratricopeptide repeat protein [Kofleriaceae bacterium]|nr:tetratricopeptide repeat protein [Kofleriaceae bacterium]
MSGSATATATATTAAPAILPSLPRSPDGAMEQRALDEQLHRARHPAERIPLLLERAAIRQRLEDYVDADARSAAWVAEAPASLDAWKLRARVLARLHRLADARAAVDRVRQLAREPDDWEELAATLDDAAGDHARAAAYRERAARQWPDPVRLTAWAASLTRLGRVDEALAVMPRAAAAIRQPPAAQVAWILLQWARLHERRGEPAAARQLLEAAHARMPGHVEVTVHLAEAIRATGGDPSALVAAALAAAPPAAPHPDLLALAGRLDEARAAWERHVAALPEAFADHAARFYLGAGADPRRALALARANLAHRPSDDARALAVEAALGAGEAALACELARPLAAGTRPRQFLAWQAFTACEDRGAARDLAARLGL